MKNPTRNPAIAIALTLLAGASLAAGPTLDQSNEPSAEPIPFAFAIGGASEQVLYQVVTAGLEGRLLRVRLPVACATGRLAIEIRDVEYDASKMDYVPGPTVLTRKLVEADRLPGPVSDELRTISLGSGISVSPGDLFAIALSNDEGSCGIWPGGPGDTYSGGSGWFTAVENGGELVELGLGSGREDLPFQTVVLVRGRP